MQQPPPQRNFFSILDGCSGCLGAIGGAAIFFLVGAGLAYWGWTILQNARASAAWPTAPGLVTTSEVTHSTDAEGGDSYSPEVTYTYQAEGQSFESYTIKFGENSYSSQRQAQEIAARYPVGQAVTVYYEPGNATNSVLEPGVSAGSYIVLSIGVLFVGLSILIPPLTFLFCHQGRDI